tara:strand:+ start:28360 stop:28545 length:186 start_codon:yes stop_codon:yes gene_type:complete
MRNPLGSEKEKQQLPLKEIKRKYPESQDALIDSTRFFPLKITSIIPRTLKVLGVDNKQSGK